MIEKYKSDSCWHLGHEKLICLNYKTQKEIRKIFRISGYFLVSLAHFHVTKGVFFTEAVFENNLFYKNDSFYSKYFQNLNYFDNLNDHCPNLHSTMFELLRTILLWNKIQNFLESNTYKYMVFIVLVIEWIWNNLQPVTCQLGVLEETAVSGKLTRQGAKPQACSHNIVVLLYVYCT